MNDEQRNTTDTKGKARTRKTTPEKVDQTSPQPETNIKPEEGKSEVINNTAEETKGIEMIVQGSAQITVIEPNFKAMALTSEMSEAMAEEMDGMTIKFDRIKIPSGGGTAFEIPGDDPENPDIAKVLTGVIVDQYPANAYWAEKFTGQNNPPDCASMDGKTGTDKDGAKHSCVSCHFNQWGTGHDDKGLATKGKACKNMRRIFLLREGESLPVLLTLPPTSIGNFSDYISKRIITKGRRSFGVITKITLKKVKNSTGIEYSEAVVAMAEELNETAKAIMVQYHDEIIKMTRRVEITEEDYNTEAVSSKSDTNGNSDDDLPVNGFIPENPWDGQDAKTVNEFENSMPPPPTQGDDIY